MNSTKGGRTSKVSVSLHFSFISCPAVRHKIRDDIQCTNYKKSLGLDYDWRWILAGVDVLQTKLIHLYKWARIELYDRIDKTTLPKAAPYLDRTCLNFVNQVRNCHALISDGSSQWATQIKVWSLCCFGVARSDTRPLPTAAVWGGQLQNRDLQPHLDRSRDFTYVKSLI